jgi:hypothetical protein
MFKVVMFMIYFDYILNITFFHNGKAEFHYPRAMKLQEFDNSKKTTPKT